MNRLKLILSILFLAIMQAGFACDCYSLGAFLEDAPAKKLVALVKVTEYLTFDNIYEDETPMSMEVEIIDVYKGMETRKFITVWGDNGVLCRPYLSKFTVGHYYVIAFDGGSDGLQAFVHENEKLTDYAISSCGAFWLKADVDKQIAEGSVTDKITQIGLSELKSRLQKL